MIVSYKWLQEYFDDKLPQTEDLAGILNTRAFEVEGIEEAGDDKIIDIDVLPNRSHDCFSHYGIAKEIGVLTGLKVKELKPEVELGSDSGISVDVKEDEKKTCKRYIALEIDNVEVTSSPDELKTKLEALGEKSINSIVDITNVVMFETGQPLHAFDKDKLDGNIQIRFAKNGEKITTLDNKEVLLDESILVIADDKDALAIAGVKGGKKAEVDQNTKNIVLESANFSSSAIRKTSNKIGIRTESSKRFENEVSPNLAETGILRAAEFIKKYSPDCEVKSLVDVYVKKAKHPYYTGVSLKEVNSLLGSSLADKEVEETLDKLGFEYKKVNTKECVVEEIKKYLGNPHNTFPSITYDAPDEFDCSSLIAYSYAVCGLSIPRLTIDQYVWGEEISKDELEPGDLIFANKEEGKIYYETISFLPGTKVEKGIDHVGMYLGDGKVIHSSRYTEKTVIENLEKSERFTDPVGYRRMIEKGEERYAITVPDVRLDLRIKEEIIEEIGRVYGYENIEDAPIKDMDFEAKLNKAHEYNNLIRKTLAGEGFSEIMTQTFVEKGEVAPQKPIASDKAFLRDSLSADIQKTFDLNLYNADLLTLDHVKIFEIGKVYKKDKEELHLLIAVANNKIKKPKAESLIDEAVSKLNEALGSDIKATINEIPASAGMAGKIVEISLDEVYEKLENPKESTKLPEIEDDIRYSIPSQYPFMLRDISVWVEEGKSKQDVLNIIVENAGELLVNHKLVDVYPKDGRVSYAYRLVFQSNEKTLTDEEINKIMESISEKMTSEGWEVR